MELLTADSREKEERHLKLLTKYKNSIDQAINFTKASKVEDPKLLHVKVTQLEKELHLAKVEKERVERRVRNLVG